MLTSVYVSGHIHSSLNSPNISHISDTEVTGPKRSIKHNKGRQKGPIIPPTLFRMSPELSESSCPAWPSLLKITAIRVKYQKETLPKPRSKSYWKSHCPPKSAPEVSAEGKSVCTHFLIPTFIFAVTAVTLPDAGQCQTGSRAICPPLSATVYI